MAFWEQLEWGISYQTGLGGQKRNGSIELRLISKITNSQWSSLIAPLLRDINSNAQHKSWTSFQEDAANIQLISRISKNGKTN